MLETHQTGGQPMKEKAFDGQVLKDYWTDVRTAPLVKLTAQAPQPKEATQFQIQREGSILHIGVICLEPDMANANVATTTSDDPKLLEGDYISLLIETASNSYYEIAINPAGAVLEIDHGKDGPGVKWTSGARAAVQRGEKKWSIEMRVPITREGSRMIDPLKGIDGAQPKDLFPWYFNVGRQRVRAARSSALPTPPPGRRVSMCRRSSPSFGGRGSDGECSGLVSVHGLGVSARSW